VNYHCLVWLHIESIFWNRLQPNQCNQLAFQHFLWLKWCILCDFSATIVNYPFYIGLVAYCTNLVKPNFSSANNPINHGGPRKASGDQPQNSLSTSNNPAAPTSGAETLAPKLGSFNLDDEQEFPPVAHTSGWLVFSFDFSPMYTCRQFLLLYYNEIYLLIEILFEFLCVNVFSDFLSFWIYFMAEI